MLSSFLKERGHEGEPQKKRKKKEKEKEKESCKYHDMTFLASESVTIIKRRS